MIGQELAAQQYVTAWMSGGKSKPRTVSEQQLRELREQLSQRHERVEKHIKHREGPLSADFAEQATERQNDAVVFALDQNLTLELQAIDAALKRIENDEFGVCTACGDEIEAARLDAIPWTTTCVSCKEL